MSGPFGIHRVSIYYDYTCLSQKPSLNYHKFGSKSNSKKYLHFIFKLEALLLYKFICINARHQNRFISLFFTLELHNQSFHILASEKSGTRANMYTGYIPLGKFVCLHCLILFSFALLKIFMNSFRGLVTDESASSFSVFPDDVTFSLTIITPFSARAFLKSNRYLII